MRLFSTEQVTKYHPDKYADQISDAVVTDCLRIDKRSRVACECLVKNDIVVLAGEITTAAEIDYDRVVKRVSDKLGYKVSQVIKLINQQSREIGASVDTGGAGDQGMMYGFASAETDNFLPYGFDLANKIVKIIEHDVDDNSLTPLLGDAKVQVTVDLDKDPNIKSVKSILISACHDKSASISDVRRHIASLLSDLNTRLLINPAGEWTVGGPFADCGLTGRKIVCDQYGGYAPVGGGAFSGKDPTKVDRSGAYIARKIAIDLVRFFGLKQSEVQIAYAIGVDKPVSVYCKNLSANCFNSFIKKYDLTPMGIIKELNLLNTNFEEVSEGCHFRHEWCG